jgi:ribonuclease P protein component
MRFTFKKDERLSGHAALEAVYQKGKYLSNTHFKFIFLQVENASEPICRVVFSVPKRNFKKAVDRNRIKRQIREVYRLHKYLFYEKLAEKQIKLHLYIIYTAKQIIDFSELQENLVKGLDGIVNKY